MDLAEFLLARIAEDEAAARRLSADRWYVCDDGHMETPLDTGPDGEDNLPNHHNSWHLVLDPARVLAECEAKRRIVELHHPSGEYDPDACVLCQWDIDCESPGAGTFPCDTLRLLAASYRHPDYDPAWAVEATATA